MVGGLSSVAVRLQRLMSVHELCMCFPFRALSLHALGRDRSRSRVRHICKVSCKHKDILCVDSREIKRFPKKSQKTSNQTVAIVAAARSCVFVWLKSDSALEAQLGWRCSLMTPIQADYFPRGTHFHVREGWVLWHGVLC